MAFVNMHSFRCRFLTSDTPNMENGVEREIPRSTYLFRRRLGIQPYLEIRLQL
jgi:hypothetical protein